MTERDDRPVPSRALVPVLVLIGTVTSVISSLGAPLLPTIARVDHVSLSDAQWSLTITVLVGALAAPVMGRLGDGPARRRAILAGLVVVIAGSALAGLPVNSFLLLLVGRGMHGLGLALMPLTMAVARDSLPPDRSARAIAVLSITTVGGIGLGYPITGLVDESLGLHATFWFGAIVAGIALVVSIPVLPRTGHLRRRPLDILGAVLLSAALVAILLPLTEAQPWGWTSPKVIGLLVIGVVLVVAWVARERSVELPLVELRLLRHRSVGLTNCTGFLMAVSMYMFLPVLTDFVQTPPSAGYGFGASVVEVGLMLIPFSFFSASMSRVAAAVNARLGPHRLIPVGAIGLAVATGLFSVAGGALWEGFLAMGIAGVGVGFSFAAMPGLIVRAVPANETGSALAFFNVVRYVGLSVGSGVSTSILAAYTPAGASLPQRAGFTVALAVGAVISLVAGVFGASIGRPATVTRQKLRSSSLGSSPVPVEEAAAEILFE